MTLNGSGKFVLPITLFIALIAAIVMVARLDTKVEFLINQHQEYKIQTANDIKVTSLEVNALRLEIAELRGKNSVKGGK